MASERRRSRWPANRRWTRPPSGWVSTRWRSVGATSSSLRERPWPRVRGIDADLAADLALAAAELEWDTPDRPGTRSGHLHLGLGRRLRADDHGHRPGPLGRLGDGHLRQHRDGPGLVHRAGPDDRRRDGRRHGARPPAPERHRGGQLRPLDRGQPDDDPDGPGHRGGGPRRARPSSCRGPRSRWPPTARRSIEEHSGVRIGDAFHDWGAIVRAWFGGSAGEVIGRGYLRKSGATEEMPPFWEIGCVGVEVSIDESTGELRVERLVTIGDVGCAINPQLVEGQDIGRGDDGPGHGHARGARLRGRQPHERQPVRLPGAAHDRPARAAARSSSSAATASGCTGPRAAARARSTRSRRPSPTPPIAPPASACARRRSRPSASGRPSRSATPPVDERPSTPESATGGAGSRPCPTLSDAARRLRPRPARGLAAVRGRPRTRRRMPTVDDRAARSGRH